ncbi:MAG: hypothetical protein ACRDBM_10380 [Sporomusa sp.]
MKAVFKNKKVKYGGVFHPANTKFNIGENDAEHLKGIGAMIIETANDSTGADNVDADSTDTDNAATETKTGKKAK